MVETAHLRADISRLCGELRAARASAQGVLAQSRSASPAAGSQQDGGGAKDGTNDTVAQLPTLASVQLPEPVLVRPRPLEGRMVAGGGHDHAGSGETMVVASPARGDGGSRPPSPGAPSRPMPAAPSSAVVRGSPSRPRQLQSHLTLLPPNQREFAPVGEVEPSKLAWLRGHRVEMAQVVDALGAHGGGGSGAPPATSVLSAHATPITPHPDAPGAFTPHASPSRGDAHRSILDNGTGGGGGTSVSGIGLPPPPPVVTPAGPAGFGGIAFADGDDSVGACERLLNHMNGLQQQCHLQGVQLQMLQAENRALRGRLDAAGDEARLSPVGGDESHHGLNRGWSSPSASGGRGSPAAAMAPQRRGGGGGGAASDAAAVALGSRQSSVRRLERARLDTTATPAPVAADADEVFIEAGPAASRLRGDPQVAPQQQQVTAADVPERRGPTHTPVLDDDPYARLREEVEGNVWPRGGAEGHAPAAGDATASPVLRDDLSMTVVTTCADDDDPAAHPTASREMSAHRVATMDHTHAQHRHHSLPALAHTATAGGASVSRMQPSSQSLGGAAGAHNVAVRMDTMGTADIGDYTPYQPGQVIPLVGGPVRSAGDADSDGGSSASQPRRRRRRRREDRDRRHRRRREGGDDADDANDHYSHAPGGGGAGWGGYRCIEGDGGGGAGGVMDEVEAALEALLEGKRRSGQPLRIVGGGGAADVAACAAHCLYDLHPEDRADILAAVRAADAGRPLLPHAGSCARAAHHHLPGGAALDGLHPDDRAEIVDLVLQQISVGACEDDVGRDRDRQHRRRRRRRRDD